MPCACSATASVSDVCGFSFDKTEDLNNGFLDHG
jgi:hypothetical protein